MQDVEDHDLAASVQDACSSQPTRQGKTEEMLLCSDRERSRGDREVWEALNDHTVGVKENTAGLKVKFAFDTVFEGSTSNKQVCPSLPHIHFNIKND